MYEKRVWVVLGWPENFQVNSKHTFNTWKNPKVYFTSFFFSHNKGRSSQDQLHVRYSICKGGLISEISLNLELRIVIWHIFLRIEANWKCPLRLLTWLYEIDMGFDLFWRSTQCLVLLRLYLKTLSTFTLYNKLSLKYPQISQYEWRFRRFRR